MATILTTDHYDAVRALIAPDVTAAHISDAYLSQQPFAPDAERKVRKRLRDAQIDVDALAGADLVDARLAMIHACAAVLCLTAPQLLRQTELQVVTEVQRVDWKEKRQFHQAEVNERVDDIVERLQQGSAPPKRSRALPFGSVGTERTAVGRPTSPYTRSKG